MLRFGILLSVVLAAFWVSLSGYFTVMLLSLGVISIALVLGLCFRMRILDTETVPYKYTWPTFSYFGWLGGEIVKANMTVVKAVLSPAMEISPTMVKIPSPQKTDLGKTMFANSITLTPGTVSLVMEDGGILVHALLKEMSSPADFVEMGERSARAVGEKGDS